MILNFILIILILIAGGVAGFLFVKSGNQVKELSKFKAEKLKLENIIASMSDGVILYDQDFTIQIFNSGAEAIFNLPAKEIIGQKLSPESIKNLKLEILAKTVFQSLAPLVVRQSPEGVYPQVVDISFDNPRLELRVITDRVLNEAGQVAGFLKIVSDRTREAELIKSKNDFITVAAHQLRTPLSAVSWTFQSLKNETLSDSQKELVDTGLAASSNLLKIVEDLLNVSKIEEGKFGYNFQKIDLVKFLQSILDQADLVAKEYNVKVYMEPPQESQILLEVDSEKLGLAVSNLLENGIKYNVPSGHVVLSVERRSDAPFIQVNISDTGLGIPEDAMDKLFGKFFRAENVITKATEGSGLGLYIVKNIIRRHGGQVWVESVVGRGTTFHFTLPTDPRLIPQKEIAYGEAS